MARQYSAPLFYTTGQQMRLLVICFIAVASFAGGYFCSGLMATKLLSGERFFFVDKISDNQLGYLSARGTWKGTDLATKVNAVRIFCYIAEQRCALSQANVLDSGGRNSVYLYENDFKIGKIDQASLVAAADEQCIRQTILVDRQSKSVSLIRTKINKSEDCSIVQDAPFSLSLSDPQ